MAKHRMAPVSHLFVGGRDQRQERLQDVGAFENIAVPLVIAPACEAHRVQSIYGVKCIGRVHIIEQIQLKPISLFEGEPIQLASVQC